MKGKRRHGVRAGGSQPGLVRIIGGQWRSRRLPIVDVPGLRPTGDRVRETLFNWLSPWLPGSRCLDLYAGAGALGLEAASRGAAEVVLVEVNQRAVDGLRSNVETLAAGNVTVVHADAGGWMDQAGSRFDVIFIDPPFDLGNVETVLKQAADHVVERGWIYLERPAQAQVQLPPTLETYRDRTFSDVRALLLRKSSEK